LHRGSGRSCVSSAGPPLLGEINSTALPVYPGHANRIHRSFDDPAAVEGSEEVRLAAFRRVRDQIRDYLKTFPLQS